MLASCKQNQVEILARDTKFGLVCVIGVIVPACSDRGCDAPTVSLLHNNDSMTSPSHLVVTRSTSNGLIIAFAHSNL
jgi:hypothetical protein